MRKVFFDNLPKRKSGQILWNKSIGQDLHFIYEEIEGLIKIVDYNTNGKYNIVLQYNDNIKSLTSDDLLKLSIANDNIVDVGFGISQGLPVIISGLLLNKHETLLLEQPEIHLHPNMQMKMADFLISQAYNKKNIICETHSDHIINRIVRRVMEDKTGNLQNLVKIYFVQGKNVDNPIYKDISIHPVDGLVNAPEEFFTQFGSETIRIAQTGMINMREGVKW